MVSRLTPGVFYYKIRPFAYIYICAYIGDCTMRQKCSGREKQSATMIWLLALALWVRPPPSCSISLWGVWKELGKSKKKALYNWASRFISANNGCNTRPDSRWASRTRYVYRHPSARIDSTLRAIKKIISAAGRREIERGNSIKKEWAYLIITSIYRHISYIDMRERESFDAPSTPTSETIGF